MPISKRMFAGLCSLTLLALACGRQFDKLVEEARFALDTGDTATAITKATEALALDPTDFDATLILSAGFSARAGVDLLELAKQLTTSGIEDEAFNAIHDTLVASIGSGGLADLRLAVTTLTGYTGTIKNQGQYTFQVGILQAIEAFGRPSITAQPTLAGTITPTSISAADATIVSDDLIAADGNLLTSGVASDNQLITSIRKSYCVLKNRSAGSGFTTAELQDRVRCELDENRASLVAADFQSATVTTCADFDFSACTAVDTSL